jgi:Na+-transporting NADH:ubiquinone oxidoreductase subunit F
MIFVAGGSGMAPIVSILYYMRNSGIERRTSYFFGANRVKDIYLTELMRQFESDLPNFNFIPVVAQLENENWSGETGLVTEAVRRHLSNVDSYEGYLCGSPGMIEAATKVLVDRGMPVDKIYYDKFE